MAVIDQDVSDRYAIYNADCMEVLPTLKAESVAVSVYSPPFPELYQYSNDPRDMSNCTEYEEGIQHYRFVVQQIARVTKRGRLSCVHAMDLKRGAYFNRDFPGDIVRVHEEAGMHYVCRVTIWKDPWLIARRTRMKSLRHKNICEDSATVRIGPADYVLVFKRGWENPEPIQHPHGLKAYAGETQIPEDLIAKYKDFKGDQRTNRLSHWIWRHYASPVWMDIRSGRLLPYQDSKENDEEKHVCPLQLDVIERLLTLYSNPDDVALTPFMGVGSEVYGALTMGRKAIGIELKESYYRQACKNIKAALSAEKIEETRLDFGDEPQEDEVEEEVFTE